MSEPWKPSDEEIDESVHQAIAPHNYPVYELFAVGFRAVVRAAVEKAVAEERAFQNTYSVAAHEELMRQAEARHARELERARLAAKAEAFETFGPLSEEFAWAHKQAARYRVALAALDKEGA